MVFVGGIGLAALVGSRALGAALIAGLVLYGVEYPLGLSLSSPDPAVALVLAVAAAGLGCLAAATPWRAWLAAAAGTVTLFAASTDRVSVAMAMVVLSLVVFALVTAYATAAVAIAGCTQVPAVLGVVAVAIQVGLHDAAALLVHSGIGDGNPYSTGPEQMVMSGTALLFGAVLVIVVRLMPTSRPADQSELSPGVPVAR